jgi:hypothetical protein
LKPQFFPAHLSLIGLVVVSQQVEHAMGSQDPQLPLKGMLLLKGLAVGSFHGDDNITQVTVLKAQALIGRGMIRERQHVGSLVLVAKTPIEAADCPIVSQQDNEFFVRDSKVAAQSKQKSIQAGNSNRIPPLAIEND